MSTDHSSGDPWQAAGTHADPSPPPGPYPVAAARVTRLCTLEQTLGRIEECPRGSCPFWERGGAVLEPGCLLERFLPAEDWTPELAAHWLRVRRAAERRGDR